MIEYMAYVILVAAIMGAGAFIIIQGRIIDELRGEIRVTRKDLEALNKRIAVKQKKLDDLKMRFIAENTMVRRKTDHG